MKCESCNVQIDPKWKNAIEKNECPFCGEFIMDNNLKELLLEAKDIFDNLMQENYKDAFVDWIKANYNFVLFNNKIAPDQNASNTSTKDEVVLNKKGPIPLDFFLKNAKGPNINKDEKENRIQGAMSKISSSGEAGGGLSLESHLRKEFPGIEPLSHNELADISSAVGDSSYTDAEIPQVVIDMAEMARNNPKDYNPRHISILQQQFDKQRESSEAINIGGRKKGFSRA